MPFSRAKFARAYDWADITRYFFTDEHDNHDASMTWISEIGLQLGADVSIYVGVLDADANAIAECPASVFTCFASGVIKVAIVAVVRSRSVRLAWPGLTWPRFCPPPPPLTAPLFVSS